MRILLNTTFVLGLAMALGCGASLIWWDLSSTNRSEHWRTQTGTSGYLTVWLACMIAYIDRLWQRTPPEESKHMQSDFLIGLVLAAAAVVVAYSGVEYLFDGSPRERST